jgi:hypothetical protein
MSPYGSLCAQACRTCTSRKTLHIYLKFAVMPPGNGKNCPHSQSRTPPCCLVCRPLRHQAADATGSRCRSPASASASSRDQGIATHATHPCSRRHVLKRLIAIGAALLELSRPKTAAAVGLGTLPTSPLLSVGLSVCPIVFLLSHMSMCCLAVQTIARACLQYSLNFRRQKRKLSCTPPGSVVGDLAGTPEEEGTAQLLPTSAAPDLSLSEKKVRWLRYLFPPLKLSIRLRLPVHSSALLPILFVRSVLLIVCLQVLPAHSSIHLRLHCQETVFDHIFATTL